MQAAVAYEESHVKELPRWADRPGLADPRSWVCLAIASILLLFSNGANNVALPAWLAPVFMLRFVRRRGLYDFLSVAFALLVSAFVFSLWGIVPLNAVSTAIFIA